MVACGRFQHHCGCQHPHDDVLRAGDDVRCGDDGCCDDDDDDFVGCDYVVNDDVPVAVVAVGDGLHCDRILWLKSRHRHHSRYHLRPSNSHNFEELEHAPGILCTVKTGIDPYLLRFASLNYINFQKNV